MDLIAEYYVRRLGEGDGLVIYYPFIGSRYAWPHAHSFAFARGVVLSALADCAYTKNCYTNSLKVDSLNSLHLLV